MSLINTRATLGYASSVLLIAEKRDMIIKWVHYAALIYYNLKVNLGLQLGNVSI